MARRSDRIKGITMFDKIRQLFTPSSTPAPADFGPLPYHRPSLAEHLAPAGQKRVLALDGGGVRGTMAVAILEHIEAMLRDAHGGHPDFRLCDYFDLIGGTSTGSIIAGGLAAKRFTAADIKEFYFEMGPEVFRSGLFRQGFTRAKFDAARLRNRLGKVFGDVALGSAEMATGFAAVTKRIDTDSVWVLTNNPNGAYFNDPEDGSYVGNKHYPLRNVIRASTAAPHYFKPERIEIIKGKEYGMFVDGAMSPHNNPSFQLLMLAGLSGYNFGWTLTPDRLMMISIGTGSMAEKKRDGGFTPQIARTLNALTSMITSAEDFVELLMQWVSESNDPRRIDGEVGDLRSDLLANGPLLKYERYQSVLTRKRLREDFGFNATDKQVSKLRKLDDASSMPMAYELGQAMAEKLVKSVHFPTNFTLPSS